MAKRRTHRTTERRGKRVILYGRVSDVAGREETLISPEVQIMEGELTSAREGLTIVPLPGDSPALNPYYPAVIELDKSGRTSDTRRIADIISAIDAGEADGVLVWKISRWGRNTMDSLLNIGELQAAGGFIVSAKENLTDIETPAGKFSLTVLLAIAQMFSDEIGRTWASIHDYRISIGKTASKTWRLGYLRECDIPDGADPGEYVFPKGVDYIPNPKTSEWVEKVFEWHESGLGLIKAASRINAKGVRTYTGKEFNYDGLRNALDGGFQAGLIVDRTGPEIVYHPGSHQGLISAERFYAYQARIAQKISPANKTAQHKVTRLMFCDSCGYRMRVGYKVDRKSGKTSLQWRCEAWKGNAARKCEQPATIVNSLVEDLLYQWLENSAEGQSAIDAQVARAQRVTAAKADVEQIDRDINRQSSRLSILVDKVLDGTIDDSSYKEKETEIRATVARLQESKASAATEQAVNSLPSTDVFGGLMAGWDLLDPPVFNVGLSQVVGRINVRRPLHRGGRPTITVVGRWELEPESADSRTPPTGPSPRAPG